MPTRSFVVLKDFHGFLTRLRFTNSLNRRPGGFDVTRLLQLFKRSAAG